MEQFDIYKDIAERTGGSIYLGIVGPVRTGKSTFIRRFMELMVIPNIENQYTKQRAKDELPNSGSGKTITTTEPKFVPNEAVEITLDDNVKMNVRMIDCVGYLVKGAEGESEGDIPRMINTPWSERPLPFSEAAEIGTKKVITDHSTIGIVITTDGSVTDIPRENYIEAEERIIGELKALKKPFIVLLNTQSPYTAQAESISTAMSEKYGVPVTPINCAQLKQDDVSNILEKILYEFPLKEIRFHMPEWIETLDSSHWLKKEIISTLKLILDKAEKLRQSKECIDAFKDNKFIRKAYIDGVNPGDGSITIELNADPSLFYKVLSEEINIPIENDYQLITTIKKMGEIKKDYEKFQFALADVRRKGYGIVAPTFEDIKIDEPEIFKQGGRYGIKIRARGDSYHIIKTPVETEVSPVVGNEEQTKDFIGQIMNDFKTEPEKIWDLNIFGRTLNNLVSEGMQNKIYRMPEDAQIKLAETLQKIVNEGSGGLICIIL